MNGFYVLVAVMFVVAVMSQSFGWVAFVGAFFVAGLLLQYYVTKLQRQKPLAVQTLQEDSEQVPPPEGDTTKKAPPDQPKCAPFRESVRSLQKQIAPRKHTVESMQTLQNLRLREPLESRRAFAKGLMDDAATRYMVPVAY